jgi:hypothetical protein
MLKEWLAHY